MEKLSKVKTVRLSEDLYKRMQKACSELGKSESDFIREAILDKLDEVETQIALRRLVRVLSEALGPDEEGKKVMQKMMTALSPFLKKEDLEEVELWIETR